MKRDIKLIPFEDLITKGITAEEFVTTYNIKNSWDWLGTQLLAHLATYKVTLDATACVNTLDFLNTNIGSSVRERGIYRLLVQTSRSILMAKQTDKIHTPVCSLVPIYLAAQKQYNGLPFSKWKLDEHLEYVIGNDLYEAVTYVTSDVGRGLLQLTSEQLLEIRDRGLVYAGKPRKPESWHTLTKLSDTPLAKAPRLLKVMLTQIWCAHPVNRHQYMLLDPINWDNMPAPLIQAETIEEPAKPKKPLNLTELPWLQ